MRLRHLALVLLTASCQRATAEGAFPFPPQPSMGAGGGAAGTTPFSPFGCLSAADCALGESCCAASGNSACVEAPCTEPGDASPAIQLCKTDSECLVAGDHCATWHALPDPGVLMLAAPSVTVCVTEAELLEAGALDGSSEASDAGASDAPAADVGASDAGAPGDAGSASGARGNDDGGSVEDTSG